MDTTCSRRGFLGCGAYVLFALGAAPWSVRRAFAADPAFARVEKIADGLWAVISTPWQEGGGVDGTTFSNGGIIAGKDGVLVIEGFMTPKGAAWQSNLALELAGRRPTHVVLTHFHPDHSAGLPGYQRGEEAPAILATTETRRLLLEKMHKDPPEKGEGSTLGKAQFRLLLPDTIIVDTSRPTSIDLGGRTVRLTPRSGHTPSDVTIEIDEPRTVWCGDLFFNGLFPYYGDALPGPLNESVKALLAADFDVYVPGHGPRCDAGGMKPYVQLLKDVEAAARKAVEKGTPAAEAWKSYRVPEALGEWKLFRPDVFRFGFEAWERELTAAR